MTQSNLSDAPDVPPTPLSATFFPSLSKPTSPGRNRGRHGGLGDARTVFVDIGRKMDGVLPPIPRESEARHKVLVSIRGRDEEGNYLLSTIKVETPRDWSALEAAFAEKRTIGGTVLEVVKGGLRVDVGVRAFMPASRSGAREQAEMEKLVGQEIECRITKLDTATKTWWWTAAWCWKSASARPRGKPSGSCRKARWCAARCAR